MKKCDVRTDRQTNKQTDGQTDVWTDGQTGDGEVIPKCHLCLQQVTQQKKLNPSITRPILPICNYFVYNRFRFKHSFNLWKTIYKVSEQFRPYETPIYTASYSDPSCLHVLQLTGSGSERAKSLTHSTATKILTQQCDCQSLLVSI